MKCPKCDAEMETVSVQGVDVERCLGCNGLFFDAYEHRILREFAGTDEVDIGNPSVGRLMNQKRDIFCPRCVNVKMVQVQDADQPHITLDGCPQCRGFYFDAGEFTDYAHLNIMDYFKDFFARRKKNRHRP